MSNYNLLVRASAVSKLLTNDRSGKQMGETAKSLIQEQAIQDLYNLRPSFSSKETDKGNWCEQLAIDELTALDFHQYQKNEVRIHKNGFTGECDIDTGTKIIDIKNAWSASTFSWTEEQLIAKIKKSGYEDQLRTYMMLYDREESELVEVLLSTPEDLLGYSDDAEFHNVDHIPIEKRITRQSFTRCKEWEEKLLERYEQANQYYQSFINQILNK